MFDLIGIAPPQPYLVDDRAQAPLGLLYVIGGAVQAGYEAQAYSARGKSPEAIAREVPNARVYGITATVVDYPMAERIAKQLRVRHPQSTILLGGAVQTAIEYVDFDWFDCLVMGPADEAIAEILELAFADKLPLIYQATLENADHVQNPYQYWPLRLGYKVLLDDMYNESESAVLITTRGCPYDCGFCCNRELSGGKVRYRDMDSVFADVDYLLTRGITVLRISDQHFLGRPRRVAEWCERIRPYHERCGVVWRVSCRVDSGDEEMYRMMKTAGCSDVGIGVESADQQVLDAIGKRTTVEQNRECLETLGRVGLTRRALFMCGCPGTNAGTLERTMRFLLAKPFEVVSMTTLAPLPGSDIWRNPQSYRCDILPHTRKLDNLCFYMYGPAGLRDLMPYIRLWDLPDAKLEEEVRISCEIANALCLANEG